MDPDFNSKRAQICDIAENMARLESRITLSIDIISSKLRETNRIQQYLHGIDNEEIYSTPSSCPIDPTVDITTNDTTDGTTLIGDLSVMRQKRREPMTSSEFEPDMKYWSDNSAIYSSNSQDDSENQPQQPQQQQPQPQQKQQQPQMQPQMQESAHPSGLTTRPGNSDTTTELIGANCIEPLDVGVYSVQQEKPLAASENSASLGQQRETYCICGGCAWGRMINCDGCEDWFHFSCVGLHSGRKSWFCPRCFPCERKRRGNAPPKPKLLHTARP